MAEEPTTTSPAPVQTPTSAPTPPTVPSTPPVDNSKSEIERLKAENDLYKKNWDQAAPVLEVIYKDPDALTAANKAWNKAHGIPDTPPNTTVPNNTTTPPVVPSQPIENENRNALISNSVREFEKEKGFEKLTKEQRETLNIAIVKEIKEILDPADTGKSGAQLLEGVPLTKVRSILDKAYDLATKEDREKQIIEATKSGAYESATGLIGGIPSSGAPKAEEITLTAEEKNQAKKLHMTDEAYLKNKIEIMKRNGSII